MSRAICVVTVCVLFAGNVVAADFTIGPFQYDGSGNITAAGSDSFVYDGFGRMTYGDAGTGHYQTYTYDRYGNLLTVTTDQPANPQLILGVEPATNRLSDNTKPAFGTYDAAGQMTGTSFGSTFVYDAARMPKESRVDGVRKVHLYTASDERVVSITVGAGNTEASSDWALRDVASRVLRRLQRTGGSWAWREDYVYGGKRLLAAEVNTSAGTLHFFTDQLGTPRLITGNGGVEISRHAYYPFGIEVQRQTGERMKFTGQERDSGSGAATDLDYMHARYYVPIWGRFLSVDPKLQIKRAMGSPQLWNRYSYALNNPLVYTDPTGETVYIVMHTVGNGEGDDEFRRAAYTLAAQIRAQKGYDSKKDKVLVRGVASKESFARVIKEANGMQATFGKVGQVNLFSHGGPAHGPIFRQGTPSQHQDPGFLSGVGVNWDRGASASFYACDSGVNFTQMYATAQKVHTFGFEGSAAFSSTEDEWSRIQSTGPIYLIQTTGWSNGGLWGALGKWLGFNDDAVPMDRDDP